MKTLRILSLTLLLAAVTAPAQAGEWVVVANPRAGIVRLSQEEVINIFLGRYRRLASGLTAEPIDQPVDTALRANFYRQLVGKSQAEINAYWARLIFSGKTQPPRTSFGTEDALQRVASHAGALAYVERSKVDGRVTVVFEMSD